MAIKAATTRVIRQPEKYIMSFFSRASLILLLMLFINGTAQLGHFSALSDIEEPHSGQFINDII